MGENSGKLVHNPSQFTLNRSKLTCKSEKYTWKIEGYRYMFYQTCVNKLNMWITSVSLQICLITLKTKNGHIHKIVADTDGFKSEQL